MVQLCKDHRRQPKIFHRVFTNRGKREATCKKKKKSYCFINSFPLSHWNFTAKTVLDLSYLLKRTQQGASRACSLSMRNCGLAFLPHPKIIWQIQYPAQNSQCVFVCENKQTKKVHFLPNLLSILSPDLSSGNQFSHNLLSHFCEEEQADTF